MNSPTHSVVRVFLVDDHPIVIEGLCRLFEAAADIEVVGFAWTAAEALLVLPRVRPDVVLVDLGLPDLSGAELIPQVRRLIPDAKLVIVSGYGDEHRVAEAFHAGADGFLLKSAPLDDFVDGIRLAGAGGTPLSPSLACGLLRAVQRTRHPAGASGVLTSREREVARAYATGLSTRMVASRLGISTRTVETHRLRIYEKLGCKNVVDLTRLAVRTGLVEL